MDLSRYTSLNYDQVHEMEKRGMQIIVPQARENIRHIVALGLQARERWPKLDLTRTENPWKAHTEYQFTTEGLRKLMPIAQARTFASIVGDRAEFDRLDGIIRAAALPSDAKPTEVRIPAPTSDLTYGVALHEFGHLFTHDIPTTTSNANEIEAAKWVMANARYWAQGLTDSVMLGLWTRVIANSPLALSIEEFADFGRLVQAREDQG